MEFYSVYTVTDIPVYKFMPKPFLPLNCFASITSILVFLALNKMLSTLQNVQCKEYG